MQEGVIAGIPAVEVWEWTAGEIAQQAQAVSERNRREHQAQAVLAAGQAVYTGHVLGSKKGKELPEIYDCFPFWTEEEIRQLKAEQVKNIMNRWAHSKRKGGEA